MTSFSLSANTVFEVTKEKSVYSVYCQLRGSIAFSKFKNTTKYRDPCAELLLRQICDVNSLLKSSRRTSISAALMGNSLICIQFEEGERYTRSQIFTIYLLVHSFCLIEQELSRVRALENIKGLIEQINTLILTLGALSHHNQRNETQSEKLQYLTTSIRYGLLDVFGGTIYPPPANLSRESLLAWLRPLRSLVRNTKSQ